MLLKYMCKIIITICGFKSQVPFLTVYKMRELKWNYCCILLASFVVPPCFGRLNVLFLAADDMRPEIGAFLGEDFPSPVHPKIHTPNFDALAGRSLLLKRAYVQLPLCAPSRTSLLTGRRPDTTHVYTLREYWRNVSGNFTTLPQYFKQNGYESIGVGKIFHSYDASNYDDPISWSQPYFHGVENFEDWNVSWRSVPDSLLNDTPLRDEQLATRAIETLQNLADDVKANQTNFFLALGFRKPHLPFVFPESMLQYYPEDAISLPARPYASPDLPDIAWYDNAELFQHYGDVMAMNLTGDINETLPDQFVLDMRRAYHCAITWIDIQLGRVMTALDQLGLANTTIVSFFGDHGYHLGEHGQWGKLSNFELANHAPMMIHLPGLTDDGIQTRQLTEFVDLFPTLVEAAGIEHIPLCPDNSVDVELCHEGTSLLPLIQEPNKPVRKAAFSQTPRNHDVMGYTIRTDQYRYTEWVQFTSAPDFTPDWTNVLGTELYDHHNDPDEYYNRAGDQEYSEQKTSLRKVLHQGWRHAIHELTEPAQIVG